MLFRKYYFQFYFLPEFKGVKSVSVIVIVVSLIPFSSPPPSFWDLTSKTPTTNIKYTFHNLDNIFSLKSTPKKFQIMKFNSVQLRQAEITAQITELSKDGANDPNTAKTESGKNQDDDYRDYPIYFLTANFKLGIGDCIILLQFH